MTMHAGLEPSGPETYRCLGCDEPFTLSVEARVWFTDRCLQVPRRCQACRRRRKSERDRRPELANAPGGPTANARREGRSTLPDP